MPKVPRSTPKQKNSSKATSSKISSSSIRQHSEIEQAESEHLLAAKLAITEAQQALPLAIAEIEYEANNLKVLLQDEKERLTSNLEEQNLDREGHARQLSALSASKPTSIRARFMASLKTSVTQQDWTILSLHTHSRQCEKGRKER